MESSVGKLQTKTCSVCQLSTATSFHEVTADKSLVASEVN